MNTVSDLLPRLAAPRFLEERGRTQPPDPIFRWLKGSFRLIVPRQVAATARAHVGPHERPGLDKGVDLAQGTP